MEIRTNWSQVNAAFQDRVKEAVKDTKQEAAARAVRASNELRNAALNVLRGQRTGRVYRKPHTKHATYTASAPGEPPAVRTGILRMSWSIRATGDSKGNITAGINTDVKYAPILDEGGGHIAPRPFKEPIIEKAKPAVVSIFKQPFIK